MIRSLRWRLTITFVALSSLVCLALALLALGFMYGQLTSSMDAQLRLLASEFGHAIDVRDGVPYFRGWTRVVETNPKRSLGTIQLFSADGKLLESYGPKGFPALVKGTDVQFAGQQMRVRSTPLRWDGHVVGHLQLQLSTNNRDEALRDFGIIIAELTPLLLIGLGATSYFVSGKAVRPLQDNIEGLRAFLADAGHELNTPLAIIRARAETLERKLNRQGVDASDIHVISNTAERTTRLANDLMLLAEIEGAKDPRRSAVFQLESLIEQLVQDFSDRFEQNNVALEILRLDPSLVKASSDDLYRAIANLLENVLRYTDAGGKVTVELTSNEHADLITVEDSGPGIAAEHLPFIFDRFYRVDKSRSRASGGSGLGLAIVRAIVSAHGGTIQVSSTVGIGTRFVITLPKVRKSVQQFLAQKPIESGGDVKLSEKRRTT